MLNTRNHLVLEEIEALIASGGIDSFSDDELDRLISESDDRVKALSFEMFIEYNERDVELVEKLDNQLSFIELLMTVTYMVKGRVEDSQATVKPWDTLLYNRLLAKGMQPPPPPKSINQQIVGGFVKEPVPGLYEWVVTLDLASLYPNIARTLNMSPETIVVRGEPVIDAILNYQPLPRQEGLAIAANGSQYRQDFVGIIPETMGFVLDHRNVKKGEMKDWKRKQQKAISDGDEASAASFGSEARRANANQLALKVLANGGYGAIANKHFRYYDPDIAEGITMTGQTIIRFIGDRLSDKMNELMETTGKDYVIGSDTDSCMTSIEPFMNGFIAACGMPENYNDLIDVADQFVKVNLEDGVLVPQFAELAARLGSVRSTLSMKREAIADRGLFRAKKNYVLQVWDNEGVRFAKPDMKMVGIETARTTTPRMCREMLTETLEIIMNREESELVAKYMQWKDDFMAAPFHEIAFPRGVNDIGKWRGEDGLPMKGAPIQVKAAIAYNMMLDRCDMKEIERIKDGSKLKFLYLKPNNPTGLNVIGLVDGLPPEFGLNDWVDKETQFEKALTGPIESFTTLVGWNPTGRRMSLGDDYFTAAVPEPTIRLESGEPTAPPKPVKPRTSTPRVKPESDEQRVRGTTTAKAKAKKAPKPTLDGLFG